MLKNNKNICRNLLNLDSSKVKLIKKELNSHKISLLINNSDLNNISIKKDFLLQDEEYKDLAVSTLAKILKFSINSNNNYNEYSFFINKSLNIKKMKILPPESTLTNTASVSLIK